MGVETRFGLRGRTALVTGASRGIGAALAAGLAEAGADVIATGRSKARLAETGKAVEAVGRKAHLVEADIRDTETVLSLFDRLDARGLTPDILVNNAGTEEVSPSLSVTPELWDRIVDTNLKGAFFAAQSFAQARISAGRGGSIINLGSLTSAVGVPTAAPYTASKSGLLGMTRALSAEWAAQGIRVNALGPGYFRTELTEVFYRDADWQSAMRARIPMGRFGALDDLVGAAVFLASDASAYMTGQILYLDGGYLASI
ncbi:MAG: SDR family oxidoreductase [Pseudomonadota bacterium]